MMELVDEQLDYVDPLGKAWDVFSEMEYAIAIHLMAGRQKAQIQTHFELSVWEMKKYMASIRRKIKANDPAADPAKARADYRRWLGKQIIG